jgi:hypothetical protein
MRGQRQTIVKETRDGGTDRCDRIAEFDDGNPSLLDDLNLAWDIGILSSHHSGEHHAPYHRSQFPPKFTAIRGHTHRKPDTVREGKRQHMY